jgi:hypothetical protein
MSSMSRSGQANRSRLPECQLLSDLLVGPTGSLQLARLLGGKEAGRIALVRHVPEGSTPELTRRVARAQSISHPRFAKTLGLVSSNGATYIASEYMPAVTLYELRQAASAQGKTLPLSIAVRVVREALSAAAAARKLFSDGGKDDCGRILFSDTIWVAEFGEVFITEVGFASLLYDSPSRAGVPNRPGSDVDALAGLVELRDMLSLYPGTDRALGSLAKDVTAGIARLLTLTLHPDSKTKVQSLDAVGRALAAMPGTDSATEADVQRSVQDLMRSVLERRQGQIPTGERVTTHAEGDEEATRMFDAGRLMRATEQETVRPAANPEAHEEAPRSSGLAPAKLPRFENLAHQERNSGADEDVTSLFIPMKVGDSAPPPHHTALATPAPARPRTSPLPAGAHIPTPRPAAGMPSPMPSRPPESSKPTRMDEETMVTRPPPKRAFGPLVWFVLMCVFLAAFFWVLKHKPFG